MRFCLFLFVFFSMLSLESLERRPEPVHLKVSITIPCHYKHFQFIPDLLKLYAEQTVLPDEVVVSLQQYRLLSSAAIDAVKAQNWPFVLKIVFDEGSTIGVNRNNAAKNNIPKAAKTIFFHYFSCKNSP